MEVGRVKVKNSQSKDRRRKIGVAAKDGGIIFKGRKEERGYLRGGKSTPKG